MYHNKDTYHNNIQPFRHNNFTIHNTKFHNKQDKQVIIKILQVNIVLVKNLVI